MRRRACARSSRRSAAHTRDAGCGTPRAAAAASSRSSACGCGCACARAMRFCCRASPLLLPSAAGRAGGLTSLAEFAAHALALVADALALVGLGRADRADLRRQLSDHLLVGAADHDLVRAFDFDVDARQI